MLQRLRSIKRWKKVVLSLVAILGFGVLGLYANMQGLGDARTAYAKTEGETAAAQEKGRALLDRTIAQIGGADRWKQLRKQAVETTFRYTWHDGFLRALFMPLEFSGQRLSFVRGELGGAGR